MVPNEYEAPENRGAQLKAVDAIEEINGTFVQHSVGYQFENRQIIRVDSKLTHAEIIKPSLVLLTARLFSKANEDFMAAHRHYRANEFKDCVTAANRAFESMLKAICDAERWEYGTGEGQASAPVTAGIARFAINLTATNMLFLGDSYNAMKRYP